MVQWVAREWQPPALHGVREEHGGSARLGIGRVVRLEQLADVVTAQVTEQTGQLFVGTVRERLAEPIARTSWRLGEYSLADFSTGQPHQLLVLLIGHSVDQLAQRLAARTVEDGLQTPAVLRLEDVP